MPGQDALRRELRAEFALVRQESKSDIALLRRDLALWLGSLQIVGMGLLFAALKLA